MIRGSDEGLTLVVCHLEREVPAPRRADVVIDVDACDLGMGAVHKRMSVLINTLRRDQLNIRRKCVRPNSAVRNSRVEELVRLEPARLT